MASFFRIIGLILLSLALLLLGADIVSTLEGDVLRLRSTDYILGLFNASPRPWLDANPDQWWGDVLSAIVLMPAWILPGLFGFLFALATRPARRPPPPPPRPPGH
jgi:hypothetical protein